MLQAKASSPAAVRFGGKVQRRGLPPVKARGSRPELTTRENEILELVANGYSAKEAANILGIAPRTVERHTENIRLKMRARNRAHMVTQAVLIGALKIGEEPVGPRLCAECLFQPRDPTDDEAAPPVAHVPHPGREALG